MMMLPYDFRSGCIDRYSCLFVPSREAMTFTREQSNNFAMRITLVLPANMQKAHYAKFDANIVLSKYSMVTLSVDFRCPD